MNYFVWFFLDKTLVKKKRKFCLRLQKLNEIEENNIFPTFSKRKTSIFFKHWCNQAMMFSVWYMLFTTIIYQPTNQPTEKKNKFSIQVVCLFFFSVIDSDILYPYSFLVQNQQHQLIILMYAPLMHITRTHTHKIFSEKILS